MIPSGRARAGLIIAVAFLVGYLLTAQSALGILFVIAVLLVALDWAYGGGWHPAPATRQLRDSADPGLHGSGGGGRWRASDWIWYVAGVLGFLLLIIIGLALASSG